MSKFEVINKAGRAFGRFGLVVKKHSPEILMAVGVVGTVTSTVMACKATLKANDILGEMREDMNSINTVAATTPKERYSDEDHKKDVAIVYAQTAVKFVKLYAPSVIIGAASIGCMMSSNHILRKRNVALAAAYATIDKSFKEYRGRVVERFGEELEREIRYNIKAKEFSETVVDEKTGEDKVVTKTVNVADPNTYSDYARFFDCGCTGWCKDPEANLTFLKQQQNWANELLKSRGHLFLNEVYDMLGLPHSRAGQAVGWIYDEKHPIGDNFVDFGIYNIDVERVRAFVNGYERTILLDFNVDGDILDMI